MSDTDITVTISDATDINLTLDDVGLAGSSGSSGSSGTSGSCGVSGSSGTSGVSGSSGSSGSSGTSPIGTSGTSGTSGSSGTSGGTGSSGSSGSHGTSGTSGSSGSSGGTGSSGSSGSHGTSGTSGSSGSSGSSGLGSSGTSGSSPVFPWGTDGTFNSLRITGSQTNGTVGYVVNLYWGTGATIGTSGIPLGSIYIQTGTASSSDYAGTASKATSAGYAGTSGTAPLGVLPYGNFSSLTSQFATAATVAYPVILEYDDVKNGLTHSTAGTASADVQIDIAGTYLITFSAVAKTNAPNDILDIWLRVNGADVPRSNTVSKFIGTGNERIVTVAYIYTFTAGQKFTLMYWGNAAGVQMVATGTAGTPARPASPSIIVTVNKISD